MLGLGKFGESMGNGMAIVKSLVKQMKEGSILKLSRIFNLRIKKPSQTRWKKNPEPTVTSEGWWDKHFNTHLS